MCNIPNHQGNGNQNHNEIPPHTCLLSKRVGKDMGEKRALLEGMLIGIATMSTSMRFLKKILQQISILAKIRLSSNLPNDVNIFFSVLAEKVHEKLRRNKI